MSEELKKKMKILFLIPNLGHGGAEKVLVNLVNHLDREQFQITVMVLYDEGVNRASLAPYIEYKACFKRSFTGVSHLFKAFSPKQLYRWLIHDDYDIVVSYLEGQTARIISGCDDAATKKICWIHRTMTTINDSARLFRSIKEARKCYSSFDRIVSVSNDVQKAFMKLYHIDEKGNVLYNTNESEIIVAQSTEPVPEIDFSANHFKICAMGSLIPIKGFERLISVHNKLRNDGYSIQTFILGEGADNDKLQKMIKECSLTEEVSLLGYQTNPYKYLSKCDLFVCSSWSEGFSTAVTEALILGVPVVTTHVSGMQELLGDNQYGIITENSEEGLYNGIKMMLDSNELFRSYQEKAQIRGDSFSTKNTVLAVQELFEELWEKG
ncbi:glycosyltransferase [Fusicatenibacter saccharivorans]|jgi:glycosyltransferase involved in cell wall biosynthesis|uniref:glycosyltransferase n=1 Tax=Fusicatenibacter saccharivorans TaxID=1150298 RepID=UPI003F897209